MSYSSDGTFATLSVVGGGEVNDATITFDDANDRFVVTEAVAANITAGTGCQAGTLAGTVACASTGFIVNVNANGGGGNDKLTSNADPLTPAVRRHLSGGPGSDELTIGPGGGTLDGGLGNDKLTGGSGFDTFLAYETDGDDVIDGGGGSDTVDYGDSSGGELGSTGTRGRAGAVDVTLNGAAPTTGNGEGTENDSIVNVERATGGFGNDNLTGDAQANTLTGGPGNDTLNGAGGADSLTGNAGVDSLFGARAATGCRPARGTSPAPRRTLETAR